jgi:hypothetical protein
MFQPMHGGAEIAMIKALYPLGKAAHPGPEVRSSPDQATAIPSARNPLRLKKKHIELAGRPHCMGRRCLMGGERQLRVELSIRE